jgi:hypothetical protein
VRQRERTILERAVRTLSEQAAKADALIDEALDAGLDGSHQLTVHAKMLRLELLQVKADLYESLDRCLIYEPTKQKVLVAADLGGVRTVRVGGAIRTITPRVVVRGVLIFAAWSWIHAASAVR